MDGFNIFVWFEELRFWGWLGGLPWREIFLWYAASALLIILSGVKIMNTDIDNIDISLKDREDRKYIYWCIALPPLGFFVIGMFIWETWGQEIINVNVKDIRLILKQVNKDIRSDQSCDINVASILREENIDLHKEMKVKDKENKELKREIETLKDMTGGYGRSKKIKHLAAIASKSQ